MIFALIDDEYPGRNELRFLINQYMPEAVIYEAESGAHAVELFSGEILFDAAFIDIHLGDMTGTSLSGILKLKQPEVKIIFATAFDTYAVKAFDMEATDYIMKPFEPKRVQSCLDKIQKASPNVRMQQETIHKLTVSMDKKAVVVDIDDIAYLESRERQCIIHTKGSEYASSHPLSYYEKKLKQMPFFRIHKSYIINLQYVSELTPWVNGAFNIKLHGFEKISQPVSRKQVKPLKEIFKA